MKSEIHRMELKFKELMLKQESLMKQMEYSVCRRDNIQNRARSSGKILFQYILILLIA